jgi:cytochrome c-type biogenesis protein CcmH/NrfF
MKLRMAMLLLLVVLWAGPVFAQGCAMCYSSAAGTSKEGQQAISRGVMVLLLPPVGFMTIGMGLAFRYGKKRDDAFGETFSDD